MKKTRLKYTWTNLVNISILTVIQFSQGTFHKYDQLDGEPMDQYITDLKLFALECAYSTADIREEMIRDRFVCGVSSAKAREKLLQAGSNLTLSQAFTIVRAHVETQSQLRAMLKPDTSF